MYDIIQWLDNVRTPGRTITLVDNGDGTWTWAPAGTLVQQGTNMSAQNFNISERGIYDAHLTADMLLNYLRQKAWELDEAKSEEDADVATLQGLIDDLQDGITPEIGTKVLSNTGAFPFNNSKVTVPLVTTRQNGNYTVFVEVTVFSGNVGEVVVTERLTNGFKLEFTGSGANCTVKYTVLGGMY